MENIVQKGQEILDLLNLSRDEKLFAIEQASKFVSRCSEHYTHRRRIHPDMRPVAIAAAFAVALSQSEYIADNFE